MLKKFVFLFWLISFINGPLSFAQIASPNTTCLGKVCVPSTKQIGDSSLPLKGMGLLEYIKFDMYTGALYAPEAANSVDAIQGDIPKSLVLHYHRNIKVKWMLKAAENILKKNPNVDFPAIETRINEISNAFQKVEKDDRYELKYFPDQGTTLLLNGTPQVTIPGYDFAKAYIGIWLSHYPANEKFRDKLIGMKDKAS